MGGGEAPRPGLDGRLRFTSPLGLRSHVVLSPLARSSKDWPRLQAAFVEKWLPPDDEDLSESPNGPTAADAPSEQLDRMERAILKVVEAGKAGARYVSELADGKTLGVTEDVGKALRFRFDPQSDSILFERIWVALLPPVTLVFAFSPSGLSATREQWNRTTTSKPHAPSPPATGVIISTVKNMSETKGPLIAVDMGDVLALTMKTSLNLAG
ncbi:hypothetical protein FS837_003224 [Tulasnella sp. UAMH 9824]|nr:hypothetical protein FS837_003224 [Tulasnella sp. UAMH 9824]